jgi:CRISPR-associated protein (TIGR03984 family)
MTGRTALLTWSGSCDSCADLLRKVAMHASGIVGFLYAPSAAPRFFLLGSAEPTPGPGGEPLPVKEAYEVRLFDGKRDIRGRRDGNRWRIAVVSDGSVADGFSDAVAAAMQLTVNGDVPDCDFRDHEYLLWGRKARGEAQRGDWTRLTAARIGALWVPHRLEDGHDGIVMTAREYFCIAHDGNVALTGERLTGLRSIGRGDAQAKEEAGYAG